VTQCNRGKNRTRHSPRRNGPASRNRDCTIWTRLDSTSRYQALDPLFKLDLPVGRMLGRAACCGGLWQHERSIAVDGYLVGVFDGALAGSYPALAGDDGLAVEAAAGAFGQAPSEPFDFADVGLCSSAWAAMTKMTMLAVASRTSVTVCCRDCRRVGQWAGILRSRATPARGAPGRSGPGRVGLRAWCRRGRSGPRRCRSMRRSGRGRRGEQRSTPISRAACGWSG
jgi:hypothetical protein